VCQPLNHGAAQPTSLPRRRHSNIPAAAAAAVPMFRQGVTHSITIHSWEAGMHAAPCVFKTMHLLCVCTTPTSAPPLLPGRLLHCTCTQQHTTLQRTITRPRTTLSRDDQSQRGHLWTVHCQLVTYQIVALNTPSLVARAKPSS
jgi:hypothetical protein